MTRDHDVTCGSRRFGRKFDNYDKYPPLSDALRHQKKRKNA
jgi:hypothetical protein